MSFTKASGCSIAAVDNRDRNPAERQVRAEVLVLAVGGYDRPIPFPGWDLPGVLTGAELESTGEQLQDRMAADETRSSRDQNSAH